MTEPLSIDSARSEFDDVVRRLGADPGGPGAVLDVFVAFAEVRFAVPDVPESDALLFEYGIFGFSGQPRFTLSFVRQFERADDDGYVQFRCEFEYAVDAELEALGKRTVWALSTGRESVRDWWTEVSGDPCWPVLRARTPVASEIGQSEV